MKILLAADGWNKDFSASVARALRQQDVETEECALFDTTGKLHNHFLTRSIGARRAGRLGFATRTLLHRRRMAAAQKRLVRAASASSPDLVLVLSGEWVLPETVREVRARTGGAILAAWSLDDPLASDTFPESLPLYDHVFCGEPSCLLELEALCTGEVRELPAASDAEIYRPVRMTDEERRRYGSSVASVGGCLPDDRGALTAIADLGLAIWRRDARLRAPASPTLRSCLRPGFIGAQEANLVYNASRVVLHARIGPLSKAAACLFDAPASGAFQIVEDRAELSRWLKPGEEVAAYQTPAELRSLVREYLADPERCAAMARRARARVLESHTYRRRTAEILEAVGWQVPAGSARAL
jgi:spore maturation protein CgeB